MQQQCSRASLPNLGSACAGLRRGKSRLEILSPVDELAAI
jgi:hypothetical protein